MNKIISNDENFIEINNNVTNVIKDNLIDINILRNNIKSANDFLNYLKENKFINYDRFDCIENDSAIKINEFSVIKNYLNSIETSKIFSFSFLDFNKIKYVNLTANEIIIIPKEIKNFCSIEILILNNNKIAKIENLEDLKLLKRLEMRSNKIKEFKGLENKKNLEILSLSCNLLEKIEEENFPELPSLKEIGLFGNFLGNEKDIDENIKELEKLFSLLSKNANNISSLYIGGNHFLHLDKSKIIEKLKKFTFCNLIKLDGQYIN